MTESDALSNEEWYRNTDNLKVLTKPREGEHPKATQIRLQIQKLIDQELEKQNFKDQIDEHNRLALLEETEKEVKFTGNFYVKFDPNKLKNNK